MPGGFHLPGDTCPLNLHLSYIWNTFSHFLYIRGLFNRFPYITIGDTWILLRSLHEQVLEGRVSVIYCIEHTLPAGCAACKQGILGILSYCSCCLFCWVQERIYCTRCCNRFSNSAYRACRRPPRRLEVLRSGCLDSAAANNLTAYTRLFCCHMVTILPL